jgi:hypothetical protein
MPVCRALHVSVRGDDTTLKLVEVPLCYSLPCLPFQPLRPQKARQIRTFIFTPCLIAVLRNRIRRCSGLWQRLMALRKHGVERGYDEEGE